ncbi:MAG TPA: hypothetical protein PKY81_07490 [bacterium]|nr:hypothetical protein [bacterium]HPN30784.1 hypothetical protein [bacterium]
MKYHVFFNGKIIGPFTKQEILNNPEFTDEELVKEENSDNWFKLSIIFKQSINALSTAQTSKQNVSGVNLNIEGNNNISVISDNEPDISDIFYKFLDDLETYLNYRIELVSHKQKKIIEILRKKFSRQIEKIHDNTGAFIELQIDEKKKIIENEFNVKFENYKKNISEEIKTALLKQFEIEYEIKINQIKKETEQKFYEDLNNYKNEIEEKYKSIYLKSKEELIEEIEPVIKSKYENEFNEKKQDFISEAFNRLESEYERKLKLNTGIIKLESAIDVSKKIKETIDGYDKTFREKLKEEIRIELKEEMMNGILKEIKIERLKIKEDYSAQLEAERKLLEIQLKEELTKSKKILKENADKYVEDQIKKKLGQSEF